MDIITSVQHGTTTVYATDGRGNRRYFLRTATGELLLPAANELGFGVEVVNGYVDPAGSDLPHEESAMLSRRAYPALVGDGDTWRNVYWENPETDPNLIPADGGMWEALGLGYSAKINGLELPSQRKRPFVATNDGLGIDGFTADRIRLYERTLIGADTTIPDGLFNAPAAFNPFGMAGAGARGAGSIAAGPAEGTNRIKTGSDYNADAALLLEVRVVLEDTVKDDFDFPGSWWLSAVRHEPANTRGGVDPTVLYV